jgi:hypothetical protein
MKNRLIIFVFSLFLLTDFSLYSQSFFSENFDNPDSWKINSSEGVEVTSKSDVGVSGKCISFDVNFTLGSGYGGVYELVDVELPQNYQLTFWVKAKDIPSNNFEIKLVDPFRRQRLVDE